LTIEFRKVHQFVTFAIATPLQHAIADFMREDPGHEVRLPLFYAERRDRLAELLGGSRLILRKTAATYFQLVDYSQISAQSDVDFAATLVERHGVATIPLSPFSVRPVDNERLVRLCFAKGDDTLVAAAKRLAAL
jgi:methionine aminotransferase